MGRTGLNAGRKKGGAGERHHEVVTAKDRHAETLLVGHDLVVMHRLTEMG